MKPSPPRVQRSSNRRLRSSGLAARAGASLRGVLPPKAVIIRLLRARKAGYSALTAASCAGSSGALRAGIEKFAVRWNTVSSVACCAMTGIDWIADEPVPITATRLPLKSTGSCGQVPVW